MLRRGKNTHNDPDVASTMDALRKCHAHVVERGEQKYVYDALLIIIINKVIYYLILSNILLLLLLSLLSFSSNNSFFFFFFFKICYTVA